MRLQQIQTSYLYEGLDRSSSSTMMLWESAGFKLKEAALTADQIQQIFQSVEQGATAAGGNRTMLGQGKDAAAAVNKAWEDLKTKIQDSKPIAGVDKKYDDVVAKIEKGLGGPDNAVSKVIMKYRKFAKEHPIAQGLIYSALIAAAGISGAGLGGAAVLGLLKMTDKLLQGEKFSSAAYQGAKTGALAYGASKLGDYLKSKFGDEPPGPTGNGVKGDLDQAISADQAKMDALQKSYPADQGFKYSSEGRTLRILDPEGQTVRTIKIDPQTMDTKTFADLANAKGEFAAAASREQGAALSASGLNATNPDGTASAAMSRYMDASAATRVADAKLQAIQDKILDQSLSNVEGRHAARQAVSAALKSGDLTPEQGKEIIKQIGSATTNPEAAETAISKTLQSAGTAAVDTAASAPYGAGMAPEYLQRVVDAAGKSGVRFKISPEDAAKALDWQAQNGGQAAAGALKKMADGFVDHRPTLSEGRVYLVFNRVCALNNQINEGPLDAIKGAAGKAASWLQTKGKNLTTKITADKLNSAWQKAGSPTDSAELAKFLTTQGIDKGIVDKVYTDLKISTAPADTQSAGTVDIEQVKAMIAKLPTDRKVRLLKYLTKAKAEPEAKPAPAKDELGRIEPTMA